MRVAILTNNLNSFYKPLAEGLKRMLESIHVESTVFYEGIDLFDFKYRFKSINQQPLHFVSGNINRLRKLRKQRKFLQDVSRYDLVIVVSNVPVGFIRARLSGIELFRKNDPDIPVVQYTYSYLPLAGKGSLFQKHFGENAEVSSFGLERYDHYLVVSLSSPQIMPGFDNPVTLIGCNFNSGDLYPEQKEFLALLDFEREGKEQERAVQKSALKKTNTPFIELKGKYNIHQIRSIYRKSSIYFIAFQESFGFPICETQACGNLIFSPYESWLYAQHIKEDLNKPGIGYFSDNFRIYDNKTDILCEQIERAKASHDPEETRRVLLNKQGHYYYGDIEALSGFIQKVKSGEIHGQKHREYERFNSLIDMHDYCPPPY